MGLMETIGKDLQAAMKTGDSLRLSTLRTLRAGLLEKQIERRGAGAQMTPEDEISVLLAASKQRKESIELFLAGNRKEMADQEQRELEIIREYLPKQLSAAEAEETVVRILKETGASGAKDFGKVMPQVMRILKGKADGKLVQETVKRLLGN